MERGRIGVKFQTLEGLATVMMQVAQWLDADPESFAEAYEPKPDEPEITGELGELAALFAELERLEATVLTGHQSTQQKLSR